MLNLVSKQSTTFLPLLWKLMEQDVTEKKCEKWEYLCLVMSAGEVVLAR